MTKVFHLKNGITCVCEPRPQSGKVSMIVNIKSGSLHEGLDEAGLTNLTQEAAWGGTTSRSMEQIFEDIESRGGTFGSDTTRRNTSFTASALTRDTEFIFSVLTDVIRNPAYDPEEIRKTKERICIGIDGENQNPAVRASQEYMKVAFEGQSAATPPAGTKDLVNSFTPQQIKQKHAELLSKPENIIISFAGDITAKTAEKLAKRYFGDLKAVAATPATPSLAFRGGDYREANNNNQLNLVFGFKAPSINDPRRYHMALLQELIDGGMSSPLFVEVREKRGLVYSVGASYSPLDDTGLFSIRAGTGKGNAGELINVSLNLLGEVLQKGFTDAEMKTACERLIREKQAAQESAGAVCGGNASQIMTYGRVVPLEEFESALQKVTSDDIRTTLLDSLKTGEYALGAIGPQDTMPTPDEIKKLILKQTQSVNVPAVTAAISPSLTPVFKGAAKAKKATKADPEVTTLPNGMIVVTAERPGTLSCGAWVGAGSDHETPDINGATHMNEHMMFKGTPSYGPGTIDKTIESDLGGSLNAYTSNDQTAYYFYNLLPKDISQVVDICGEMVFKANIAHDEFDGKTVTQPDGTTVKAKGERDVVIEEIKRANDDIGRRLFYILAEQMYPQQPHGLPVLGTEDTLRAMTVQKLSAYRDEYYVPNNVVFSAAGPIKHKDFVKLIEQKFGSMPFRAIPDLPAQTYHGGTAYQEMESAELCEMYIGFEGVPSTHPDFPSYQAMSMILGGGASSRLSKAIVNTGLSDSAGAGHVGYRNCGFLYSGVSVEPAKAKTAAQIILSELRKLPDTLTQGELDKVKARMEIAALAKVEKNRDACDSYGRQTLAAGKPETAADITAKINSITLADIERVARKTLASNPSVSMIVPQGTDPQLLPTHQEILNYRDQGLALAGQGNIPTPQVP
ncbi:MAG: M16 family metallopeptidase [Micavibrio sp.]